MKFYILLVLLFLLPFAFSHEKVSPEIHSIADEVLAGNRIDCSKLSRQEIILLGDELMERMMGENHEAIDASFGEQADDMHYMMGVMHGCQQGQNMMGGMKMMNPWMMAGWSLWSILYLAILIGIVILIYLWIIKLLRELKRKR